MNASFSQGIQKLYVYHSSDLKVVNGYNLGAELSYAAEMSLDDAYHLDQQAQPVEINVQAEGERHFRIIQKSPAGTPGHILVFDCVMTLMSSLGDIIEIIVLIETDDENRICNIYALPVSDLQKMRKYVLIEINTAQPRTRFGEIAFVSFGAGTLITLESGAKCPVEKLQSRDVVLTKDCNAQILRWIGCTTVRATGDFAPVRIRAGALHNTRDLVVSPDHRLIIRQTQDTLSIGQSEVTVRARHLINGDTIIQEFGGFVDYFQLLFDDHQIIYAEDQPAETLCLTDQTRAALPDEAICALETTSHVPHSHMNYEVIPEQLSALNLANLKQYSQD